MKKPNLFEHATRELSQDAFLVWLIEWAKKENAEVDPNLHKTACAFLIELIGESNSYKINKVETHRQWKKRIDVVAIINDDYFIAIEDKKGTNEYPNQLKTYADLIQKEFGTSGIKIVLVYYKMEEQGSYVNIENSGYAVFTRQKMIKVLEDNHPLLNEGNGNCILVDYYRHLKNLDEQINSFKYLPYQKWHWYSWKGFFSNIQEQIGAEWDYVSNPSGGFLGLHWYWNTIRVKNIEFKIFILLEGRGDGFSRLSYKFTTEHVLERNSFRENYRKSLFKAAKDNNIKIKNFGRAGKFMGAATLIDDYRISNDKGFIDMDATIQNLKRMEKLIDAVKAEMEMSN